MDAVLWLVEAIALLLEAAAALLIAVGAAEAFVGSFRVLRRDSTLMDRKALWLKFARWLILGLEFELAADLLNTVIAPTWTEIGQLAAIAAIRTGLNFFLARDMEGIRAVRHEPAPLSRRAQPTPSH